MQKACWVIMRIEIESGRLPLARTLKCVDCGKPANGYDHRDYRKPVEVEAVCRRHNRLRGRAAPFDHMPTCLPKREGIVKDPQSPRGYAIRPYSRKEMEERAAAAYKKVESERRAAIAAAAGFAISLSDI